LTIIKQGESLKSAVRLVASFVNSLWKASYKKWKQS